MTVGNGGERGAMAQSGGHVTTERGSYVRTVITLDGPAASGKSSVARRVAGRLDSDLANESLRISSIRSVRVLVWSSGSCVKSRGGCSPCDFRSSAIGHRSRYSGHAAPIIVLFAAHANSVKLRFQDGFLHSRYAR